MADIENTQTVSSEAADQAAQLKQFFEAVPNRRFTVERIIGQGSWGFTLQMVMRSGDRSGPTPTVKSTRFVLKRALASGGERSILVEVEALKRFRGAMHIAQPSAVLDNPRWNKTVASLSGPSLVMDWIENGLLYDFSERVVQSDDPLPNRLLWYLFLCLCRMVVALTWPPQDLGANIPPGQLVLETIPERNARGDLPPKSRMIHGDFHYRNIMLDTREPLEHNLSPVLKLIDFGMSRDVPVRQGEPEGLIGRTNVRAIGEVMLGLIRGNIRGGPGPMKITYKGEEKTINTYATDLDKLSPTYGAPADMVAKHQARIDNLDPEIRSLVAMCLAVRVEDRPDIEDLLPIVEGNVKGKTTGDYRFKRFFFNESDEAIRGILERVLFNA